MQLDAEALVETLAQKIGPLAPGVALVGIHSGGVWVAERLHAKLGCSEALGQLAVTLHRDDFARIGLHPQRKVTDMPFAVEGRHLILVDDVLNSGRTLRAALNELFDFGRPASVKLAVLADRGGRELPFTADYAAATLNLSPDERLHLKLQDGRLVFDIAPHAGMPA
ncbi:MAG: bifunctional pyr operon transcriptional regulator/uracil phosphoribosyltransferase PyrR [Betaproteobacteria bacterium]|nr:bifunctional pyr operon transcriptional regulator/uracil phosphoribosyltransferase PyrR [Betaproteobacteria bacterium]